MGQEIFSARGARLPVKDWRTGLPDVGQGSASGRNHPSGDSKLKAEGSFTFLLNSLSSFFIPFSNSHFKIPDGMFCNL